MVKFLWSKPNPTVSGTQCAKPGKNPYHPECLIYYYILICHLYHRENQSAEAATINTVCKPRRPVGGFFVWNLRQSASQNFSEKNVAVSTAPSFLEKFCEADWRNSQKK